jgi:protein-S-isoprenylcysteine O-methyltransferase Ste14
MDPQKSGSVRPIPPSLGLGMFVLVRAATYSTLFVGLLLVLLPGRVLAWSGLTRPAGLGITEIVGIALGIAGAALALWCILTFVVLGKGTPAPFDPPRQLVVRGPYRFVRNPMYLGAGLALAGAAVVYRSVALLAYVAVFLVVTHAFVILYEEPTLARLFGHGYEEYRATVRRWLPRGSPKSG